MCLKLYNELLEGVALFDINSDAKENANIFKFLKEAVLERTREEGASLVRNSLTGISRRQRRCAN